MFRKKQQILNDENCEIRYNNWMAQVMAIMMPWSLYWVAGRASAKTVQVLAERVQEVAQDLPGAPFAWVADTYSDLHKNVIPSLIDGLRFLGWDYGTHYVINEEPPSEWKLQMYNVCTEWRNTMVFFTGFNFTFISLDRLSIGAGRSYVGVFGDEVKYFPEEKFTNLLKAVRGYYARYGQSVWYRSRTLTTDMPNPNHLGEYDWILKLAKQNDKKRIMLMLYAGLAYNDAKKTYVLKKAALDKLSRADRDDTTHRYRIDKAQHQVDLALKNMKRWEERWIKTRFRTSFFFISSSYVNADVLGLEWFEDEISESLEGLSCNVLSIIPKLDADKLFYPNLTIQNFYADGYLNDVIESQALGWVEDCTCLRYHNPAAPLELGMDSGNMLSLLVGQRNSHTYRVIKEFFTLPPDTVRELGDQFLRYFAPRKNRRVLLYYDRSMNSYHKVKSDMATQIKKCIEYDRNGRRTGWSVQLMSLGQGNISSNLEYRFMQSLLSGNLAGRLFNLLIDQYNCPNLKSEMEVTQTKLVDDKSGGQIVVKQKTGDKLPRARLPKESTNLTDALKYLMMRRDYMNIWGAKSSFVPI